MHHVPTQNPNYQYFIATISTTNNVIFNIKINVKFNVISSVI